MSVDAGADQLNVEPGSTVVLTMTIGGTAATPTWSQTGGSPTVTLASSGVTRSFTAPFTMDGVSLTFTATYGAATDTVTVTVLPQNMWRKVSAGNFQALVRGRGRSPAPVVTPLAGSVPPKLSANGVPLTLTGVCIWPFDDLVTRAVSVSGTPFWQHQYNDRTKVLDTIKSWGANVVRVRVLADAYNGAQNGISKATRLQQIKTMRDAITARGMYCLLTGWDSLDGAMEDANWATTYSNAFQFWTDVRTALLLNGADDPMVIYEPWNEPNQVTDAQWQTAMQDTLAHFRSFLGYKGVMVIDGNNWSHRYNDTRMTSLEGYDAGLAGMTSGHQLVFAKHDYGDEYPNKDLWTQATWIANDGVGNTSPWVFTKHLVMESEFGNYNIDGLSHPAWSAGACTGFASLLNSGSLATFVGAIPFVYGPWSDGNALTAADNTTVTTWGGYAKNNLMAAVSH